jgi:hypothetical protein
MSEAHDGHGRDLDPEHGTTLASERYELEELFPGEGPETTHLLKVAGVVLLVVLLAIALAFPLKFL